MLCRNTRLVYYRSDETILAQAAEFMISVDPYINEPEQYTESYEGAYLASEVQSSARYQLEKDSKRFSTYIDEWNKSRNNPDTIWQGVLTAMLKCLTSSWAISDHCCRKLWKNIKPHWATFVIEFKPFPMKSKSYQGISSREQCLHWILVKFHKAATTLLEQSIAHKLLAHIDRTESDRFLFSDLKILFVCLRMRRVRAQLIPLMVFPDEYRPKVKDIFKEFSSNRMNQYEDALSSDAEEPIDVEKTAEKRAISGQYKEESSSEPADSNVEDENNEEEEDENEEEEEDSGW
ncbi:hypothetical protein BLNAU_18213 [Blattamonas nauphoetae]|uniref:Uncharacterized protein n=1 Tax=Blattamonas nauphoetae TaxID=2049346 RepID=A0ABQ9X4Z8_9EUKA|nr:hypothetical protein BLNAU_18213 [Blattamonas nauphoetae]